MRTAHWPLFGLRVHTPSLSLRYPDDDDVLFIAELGAAGIHDPSTMPFGFPWTDVPPPQQQRNTLQHYWLQRAEWRAEHWHLPMAVVRDGEIIGVQGLFADDFAVLSAVTTGSWLTLPYQGKGVGTEMRHAILHLAFAGLGAQYAHSGAFVDNPSSQRVSAKLGYEEEGQRRVVRRGEPAWIVGYRLLRERWERERRDDISIEGLEPCLELFGVT